jgi:hypothetical protein
MASFYTIILRHVSLVNTFLMECFYSFINNENTIVMPDGTTPFRIRVEIHKLVTNQE